MWLAKEKVRKIKEKERGKKKHDEQEGQIKKILEGLRTSETRGVLVECQGEVIGLQSSGK
jgi:hypothetical protein